MIEQRVAAATGGASPCWHGAFVAVLVAIPVFVINGMFEQKNYRNLPIKAACWIITLALMGGVLDVMNTFSSG